MGRGIAGSGGRKSRGFRRETADRVGKGIVGSGARKSRGLGRETADRVGKGIAGSDQTTDTILKMTSFNPELSCYKRERGRLNPKGPCVQSPKSKPGNRVRSGSE